MHFEKDLNKFFKYVIMYLSSKQDDEVRKYVIFNINKLEDPEKYNYLKQLELFKEEVNSYLDDYFDLEFSVKFNEMLSKRNLLELNLHIDPHKGECDECFEFTRILDKKCLNCFNK